VVPLARRRLLASHHPHHMDLPNCLDNLELPLAVLLQNQMMMTRRIRLTVMAILAPQMHSLDGGAVDTQGLKVPREMSHNRISS